MHAEAVPFGTERLTLRDREWPPVTLPRVTSVRLVRARSTDGLFGYLLLLGRRPAPRRPRPEAPDRATDGTSARARAAAERVVRGLPRSPHQELHQLARAAVSNAWGDPAHDHDPEEPAAQ